jgi:uncharacterized protein (DUF362 family)
MTIAKWAGPQELTAEDIKQIAVKLTEKAIEGLGGMGRFVKKGMVVWVKPNIGWDRAPELAANTNPEVVATVVRLCFEAGAKKVKVGDNPVNPAERTYPASGIPAAVQPLGAEVIMLDKVKFKETAINGERLKKHLLYPEILDCDLVINVPVAKHHRLSEVTACMKNYMGVIEDRKTFHQALPECITDLTRFMKPQICILDAVRVMPTNGPSGGKADYLQLQTTVAAGVDIVALDAFGAELLGRKPTDIGTIVKAEQAKLGKIDYRSLALREIAVS